MAQQAISYTAITALIIAIVVGVLVFVLYLVYFLNLDTASDYGSEWNYKTVGRETEYLAPLGHHVYSVDASNRIGGNGEIFITKPSGVPYVGRIFVIYNSSSDTPLNVKLDGTVSFPTNIGTPYTISSQIGSLFIWSNSTTVVPLILGTNLV